MELGVVLTLAFFFLMLVVGFFDTSFQPLMDYVWLLLVALVVAGWGIFFAISPYWKIGGARSVIPITGHFHNPDGMVMIVLGYLQHS